MAPVSSGLLGLGGARQWYRPAGTGGRCERSEAQQVALELEHPLGRLLLEQGGHVVGEDARSRARRFWTCLGSTVREALRAHSAAQSYWSCSRRRSRDWAGGHGPHPARGEAEEAVEADAGGGQGEQHVAPGPPGSCHRPTALSSHTCQSGLRAWGGAGRSRGNLRTGRGVPLQIRSRPPARSHVQATSPVAGRRRARRRPGQHRRLGALGPPAGAGRARPPRPPPSRPAPAAATTPPPTPTAARPRTPRRWRRATASWP